MGAKNGGPFGSCWIVCAQVALSIGDIIPYDPKLYGYDNDIGKEVLKEWPDSQANDPTNTYEDKPTAESLDCEGQASKIDDGAVDDCHSQVDWNWMIPILPKDALKIHLKFGVRFMFGRNSLDEADGADIVEERNWLVKRANALNEKWNAWTAKQKELKEAKRAVAIEKVKRSAAMQRELRKLRQEKVQLNRLGLGGSDEAKELAEKIDKMNADIKAYKKEMQLAESKILQMKEMIKEQIQIIACEHKSCTKKVKDAAKATIEVMTEACKEIYKDARDFFLKPKNPSPDDLIEELLDGDDLDLDTKSGRLKKLSELVEAATEALPSVSEAYKKFTTKLNNMGNGKNYYRVQLAKSLSELIEQIDQFILKHNSAYLKKVDDVADKVVDDFKHLTTRLTRKQNNEIGRDKTKRQKFNEMVTEACQSVQAAGEKAAKSFSKAWGKLNGLLGDAGEAIWDRAILESGRAMSKLMVFGSEVKAGWGDIKAKKDSYKKLLGEFKANPKDFINPQKWVENKWNAWTAVDEDGKNIKWKNLKQKIFQENAAENFRKLKWTKVFNGKKPKAKMSWTFEFSFGWYKNGPASVVVDLKLCGNVLDMTPVPPPAMIKVCTGGRIAVAWTPKCPWQKGKEKTHLKGTAYKSYSVGFDFWIVEIVFVKYELRWDTGVEWSTTINCWHVWHEGWGWRRRGWNRRRCCGSATPQRSTVTCMSKERVNLSSRSLRLPWK